MALLFTALYVVMFAGCQSADRTPVQSTDNISPRSVSGISDVIVHDSYPKSALLTPLPSWRTGPGKGIGFVRSEDRDTDPLDRPQTVELRVQEGDLLDIFLILSNGEGRPRTFLVTLILDYRQVEFELDGREGLLHEVSVPVKTDMEMPLRVQVSGSGAHDLQVMAFDYPYNLSLDQDYRMDLAGYVIGRRAVIVVGENEAPVRALSPSANGWPSPPEVTFRPRIGFASKDGTGEVHPSGRQLYVAQAAAGDPYRFQLYSNNPQKEENAAVYAIVFFLDFHQVNIMDQEVLVIRLEPGEEVINDIEVLLPRQPGIRQFQALYVFDPYKSILRKEVMSSFVFGSPRISIEAK